MLYQFTYDGSYLILSNDPNYVYRICRRKQITPTKSEKFLVQKLPNDRYVSSLYEVKPNVFKLDRYGKVFYLSLYDGYATISDGGTNVRV